MLASERLLVGDEVELTAAVPGRRQLQAGLRGRVVVTAENAPDGMVSVAAAGRLWLLRPQALRRVRHAGFARARR